jgi:hypothetical protein
MDIHGSAGVLTSVAMVGCRIPLCLSLVVSKLMAKSMEMRYQSSRGLHADLLYCKQWLEDKREQRTPVVVNDFAPGRYDVSDVFSFPARLYGREREIQLVRKIYEVTAKELKSQARTTALFSIPLSIIDLDERQRWPNARTTAH